MKFKDMKKLILKEIKEANSWGQLQASCGWAYSRIKYETSKYKK